MIKLPFSRRLVSPMWNYRVVCRAEDDEFVYEIREVYYNEDGSIEGWTERGSTPAGNTIEELRSDLAKMVGAAFNKPALQEIPARLIEDDEGKQEC